MHQHQLRARGQATLFAGIWLAAFVPFFDLGVLGPSGYSQALQASYAISNYAPLVAWAVTYRILVIIVPLIQLLPLASIFLLPYTLRRVVHGEGGRMAQWLGLAGLGIYIIIALANIALLLAAAQQFAGASHQAQVAIGANYRIAAINESLIANILGGALISAWLWTINFPTARLPGLERVVGMVGVLGSALFGATAILVAYDPQQQHQALTGTTLGWFGLWLALTGYLLIRRAPVLGIEAEEAPAAPQGAE